MIKINLGSGDKRIDGYANLDKFDTFNPEYVHDLETFPYPFKDNEISNIMLSHVLEHIRQNPDIFNNIIDLYFEYEEDYNKRFLTISSNSEISFLDEFQ